MVDDRLEKFGKWIKKHLQESGFYEEQNKYKLPIDEKLVNYFRDKKIYSKKMKKIILYTLQDAYNDDIRDFICDYLYDNFYYAQQSQEYQENRGLVEVFKKWLKPSDIADLIDSYIKNKKGDDN